MCNLYMEGTRAIVDLAKCPYEFASPEFLNIHLKDISTTEKPIKTIRYEEEIVVELNEQKTRVLTEYASFIRQLESILLRSDIYGMKQDPAYHKRRSVIRKFYEYVFLNPILAARELQNYNEEQPERSVYIRGYQLFKAWLAGIIKRYTSTRLYQLVKKTGDLRAAFLSLAGLRSLYFVPSLLLEIPENAKPIETDEGKYSLPYSIGVQIYEIPGAEAYLYVQRNPIIENLRPELSKLLKRTINEQFKESFENVKWEILMNLKTREYRQYFMDKAMMEGIKISPKEAMAMGRECAAWVVGLGAHIENLAMDKERITDIYIDSENSPIYIEHTKFGLCHTLYRYNRELLERGFKNIVMTEKGRTSFDDGNPIADIVLKRLSMRCHLQRPPATFEELQGALRIMKEQPFTYPQYLNYRSMSPFFAGYDDVLVSLGCSEAVLGLKGVGKTAFTAAKITSIGTRRRIMPIQDIEEIPVRAYRKRGFHIGAARVQSSAIEAQTGRGGKLDLVTMANALLRMGDAALIINEVRSRIAVQGIINLLNTQPGVFLLYNLHAESLRDVQDRLELVFGLPAASMYATDRYTFLKKIRFGRKGRIYRVLGYEFESDIEEKKFVEVFRFRRGDNMEDCIWETKFLRNPEANYNDFSKVDLKKLQKELDIVFIPPALARRSEETGISPEQYMLQAFFKGKVYYLIKEMSEKMEDPLLLELDFVLTTNTMANKLLASMETKGGDIDFAEAWEKWEGIFKKILKRELSKRKLKKPKIEETEEGVPKAEGEEELPEEEGIEEEEPEEEIKVEKVLEKKSEKKKKKNGVSLKEKLKKKSNALKKKKKKSRGKSKKGKKK